MTCPAERPDRAADGIVWGALATAALVRRARWQVLVLIVGLGLFGLLMYAAGPTDDRRTPRHLGWLTPLVLAESLEIQEGGRPFSSWRLA